MQIRIAYVDEPPFYAPGADGTPTGSDIELAEVVLRSVGATSIEYRLVAFDELLPGVQAGRWEVNVPIFVTPERSREVAFSMPVWSLGDGLLVAHGNPRGLTSYQDIAAAGDVRLGVIPGQVQIDTAGSAGVREDQLVLFATQPEAIGALRSGKIDAFAATGVGNRAVVASEPQLSAVSIAAPAGQGAPVGAFSVATTNTALLAVLNTELRSYLGSADHRSRMVAHGLTAAEIDPVLPN